MAAYIRVGVFVRVAMGDGIRVEVQIPVVLLVDGVKVRRIRSANRVCR